MDAVSINQQRGFLESCLEARLVSSLMEEVEESCAILGAAGSCMVALEDLVKDHHPIFNQRVDCLRMSQLPGQSRAAFVNAVVQACRDAEMEKLTTNQLVVHIILAGLSDLDTKEKWHELEDPSIKELKKAAKRLDALKIKLQQPVPGSISMVSPGTVCAVRRFGTSGRCRGEGGSGVRG